MFEGVGNGAQQCNCMILIYVYCCSGLSMFVSCLFVPCLPVILSDWSGWRETS